MGAASPAVMDGDRGASASSANAGELLQVAVECLVPSPGNRDPGDVSGLAASIKAVGVLEPLVVTASGQPGMFEIVCGRRRWTAARLAGLESVPVLVRVFSSELERREARAIENLQRVELTALEEAEEYRGLLELGMSQQALADRLGRSQGHISKRLSLLKLPAEARAALDSGGISVADALELAKLKEAGRVKAALKNGRQWGSIANAVAGQLREVEAARKRGAAIEKLKASGLTKIIEMGSHVSFYGRKERPIGTGYDQLRVDPVAHASQACHAAAVDDQGRVTLVCTRPANHPEASGKGPLTDKEKQERAQKRIRNKARREAQAARAEMMTSLLGGRVPRGEVFAHVVEQWIRHRSANQGTARVACEVLGLKAGRVKTSWGGEETDYRTPLLEHLAGGPRQLEQVGLALAFGAAEEQIRTDFPQWGESAVGAHIAFLEAHGYTVAKIETEEMAAARRGR